MTDLLAEIKIDLVGVDRQIERQPTINADSRTSAAGRGAATGAIINALLGGITRGRGRMPRNIRQPNRNIRRRDTRMQPDDSVDYTERGNVAAMLRNIDRRNGGRVELAERLNAAANLRQVSRQNAINPPVTPTVIQPREIIGARRGIDMIENKKAPNKFPLPQSFSYRELVEQSMPSRVDMKNTLTEYMKNQLLGFRENSQ